MRGPSSADLLLQHPVHQKRINLGEVGAHPGRIDADRSAVSARQQVAPVVEDEVDLSGVNKGVEGGLGSLSAAPRRLRL